MGPNGIPTGSPTAQLQAFAQSVYLMIKNRYYDDLTTSDGQTYLSSVVDWINMYIDELETEVNSDGEPINWIWVRQLNAALGTATAGNNTLSWNSTLYNNLIPGTDRFVQVLSPVDGITPMANFTVVAPADLSNDSRRNDIDMCTLVNNTITFTRAFRTQEEGGAIVGDVTGYIPRVQYTINPTGQIQATSTKVFSTVKPLTLLKLGTVKNAILPDIVVGGLNPTYTLKYNDLLTNAINRSENSAISPTADYDSYESIAGVGF